MKICYYLRDVINLHRNLKTETSIFAEKLENIHHPTRLFPKTKAVN
jgi:hypothetical protein